MDDTARDAFDSYTPAPHFCELLDGALGSSPFGHLVRQRLAAIGLTELRARSRDAAIELATLDPAPMDGGDARSAGNAVGRGRPFDVLPRIVSAADWALLERGVRQRVAALNLFVQDIYGPQRILADGVVPAELVLDNAHYRPAMRDLRLPGDTYIPCYGIDLVRGRDGAFRVLEDNVRSPSGAFAILTNRRLMQRLFADLTHDLPLLEVGDYGRQLHEALTELAPAGSTPPQVVLLSPGALDADYGEHVFLADAMGVPLVEGGDLVVEDDRVLVRSGAVTLPVDVIYRRMSDDGLDPDSLQDVPGMVQAYARGRVNLANAIGTGVADDKAIYAYVPRLIRYYLAQDPVIDNVSTRICREPDDLAYTLDHLAELVVKPVGRSGETAVTVGPRASRAELESCRERIMAAPADYISQPMLDLSVAPTLTDEGIRPRPVDLRLLAVTGRSTRVLPGGLSRIALREDALVDTRSRDGGSRDTWVLTDGATAVGAGLEQQEAVTGADDGRGRMPAPAP